jgi:hypothetical protein
MAPVSGAIFLLSSTGWRTPSATKQPEPQSAVICPVCLLAYRIQSCPRNARTVKHGHNLGGPYVTGDSRRGPARNTNALYDFISSVRQIHHWPKGADAAPEGPSYNSIPWQPSRQMQPRRDRDTGRWSETINKPAKTGATTVGWE